MMAGLLQYRLVLRSGNLPFSLHCGLRTGLKKSESALLVYGKTCRNLTSQLQNNVGLGKQSFLGKNLGRKSFSQSRMPLKDLSQSALASPKQSGAVKVNCGVVLVPVQTVCKSGMWLGSKSLGKAASSVGRHWAKLPVWLGMTVLGGACTLSALVRDRKGLVLSCSCEPLVITAPPPPPITASPNVKAAAPVTKKKSAGVFNTVWEWIRLLVRAIRLHLTFFPFLLLYPLTLLSSQFHELWLVGLLHAVEFSGPAFVKLGQWAATRRDLFSPKFCDTFSQLHYCTCVHSWENTKRILRQAYGKDWRKIFVHFGNKKNPVGSGCIAQVYQAYLSPDSLPDSVEAQDFLEDDALGEVDFAEGVEIQHLIGAEHDQGDDGGEDTADDFDVSGLIPVAVKVVHPGVRKTFQRDLRLMRTMARALEVVLPSLRWLAFSACVDEFASNMHKQLDLRTEARNLQKFYNNFASDPHIRIPKPLKHLNKQDVLVEMFEAGTPVGNFIGDSNFPPEIRRNIAEVGVDALLKMVFEDNFVHGDLHPGNILVQNAESHTSTQSSERLVLVDLCDTMVASVQDTTPPLRLVFVDCGITVQLKPDDRDKFTAVFAAVARADGEAVAELFLQRSSVVQCPNPDLFRQEMAALVSRFRQEAVSLEKVHVGELLSEVFSLVSRHRIRLESNFASIILAMGVLEGLGRSLHPDLDILERAKPILLRATLSSSNGSS